ncbi:MAG: flagellar hook-basal body complex protein FliE [Firmicutes bacterium]|nr:flagellar hook-basal body complex protein FliE [Bacillota bacterium]
MGVPGVGALGSALTAVSGAPAAGGGAGGAGFGQALAGELTRLAQETSTANSLATQFATGGGANLAAVMVATAQADLAVEGVSTVLAKALSAYQTVMQMSV